MTTGNINEALFNRILDITACIHIPLKLFAIYVVIKHTPPQMRHYSYFILNAMFWNFLANFVFTFMHILPLFPALCYRIGGLSTLFIDSELFGHLMFILMLLLITQCALALVFAFPHRYIVFVHPKLAARIRPAWVYGLCGGLQASLVLSAIIYFSTDVHAWMFLYDDYPNKAELPDRKFAFCFNPNAASKAIFNTTYMFGIIVSILVIVTSSILFLRKVKKMEKRIIHDATLALQKKVFYSLLLLTAIAMLFCFIPFVLFVCAAMFRHTLYSQEWTMICIVFLLNHGSISAIAYLLFFKACRNAVKRIFSNFIRTITRRNSKVQSVVIKSTSIASTSQNIH